jgi:hypothetical protein
MLFATAAQAQPELCCVLDHMICLIITHVPAMKRLQPWLYATMRGIRDKPVLQGLLF